MATDHISACDDNNYNARHLVYFDIFCEAVNIAGKKILEIGGAVDPEKIGKFRPNSWTSIDINARRFDECLGGRKLPVWYNAIVADATDMQFSSESFDIVYTTDCFEHVSDLDTVLQESYRVLKPGGMLFSKFAPIWSGPVGHHLWVEHEGRVFTFNDDLIPNWGHLLNTRESMEEFLCKKMPSELVRKIVAYMYDSNDINRLFDFEFEAALNGIGFERIVFLSLKSQKKLSEVTRSRLKSRYSKVIDFRTDGFFWLLAKPPIDLVTKLSAWFGLIKIIPKHYNIKKILRSILRTK